MLKLLEWTADSSIALIVVHGVGEHAGRYDQFATKMRDQGVDVFCYNQVGHGGRQPQGHIDCWKDYRRELEEAVELVSAKGYHHVGVLGHSMGSLVVMDWLQHTALRVSFAILSGTLIQVEAPKWKILLARVSARFFPQLTIPLGLDVAGISSLDDEVLRYQRDPLVFSKVSAQWGIEVLNRITQVRERVAKLSYLPILVGHGIDDPINSVEGSRWLAQQLDNISLRAYQGARHELHHDWCAKQWDADILDLIGARTGS